MWVSRDKILEFRDPPFWPNFELFSLTLTAVRHRAKFEVYSFNGSRDIRGS